MHITKLIISNFKMFENRTFDFNKDINILVGDNESGKSTILEAIEIGLNCSYRGKYLASEVTTDLFNIGAVGKYLESDKSASKLPEICIELFLDNLPEYRGENNSLGEDSHGISLKIVFDEELSTEYEELIKKPDDIKTIPAEFYKIEWLDFAWKKIKFMNKKVNGLFIDPARLHPTYGKNQYISKIIKTTLTKEQHALLNLNYRQLKEQFNDQPQVANINKQLDSDKVITEKDLQIVANVSSTNSVETGLQLAVDRINFPHIGRGEQNNIQIKLAIQNKAKNIDVIMLEEPENHLSHVNLSKLVNYIEEHRNEKQLFITTHSSYVLNKLNLNKLCLISEKYKRLNEIEKDVSRRLKRLPGYDTLRAVLSKKVVLVEGPSDELILKKMYLVKHGRLPEEDGIDIIVVRGLGFENYLQIAKHIGTKLNVVKDNDGCYENKIKRYMEMYKEYDFIEFHSSEDDNLYSLEPAMIASNSENEVTLNTYAKITLSTQTFKIYEKEKSKVNRIKFLEEWYKDKGGAGKKKVDSAMRIFESDKKIVYPDFLKRALNFD
ncbi:MAG: AAA family ATPase [Candidatus Hatepunaea meridiana]|nr:AAA family ATPase [Candidatus Hatepunaea meridiana]